VAIDEDTPPLDDADEDERAHARMTHLVGKLARDEDLRRIARAYLAAVRAAAYKRSPSATPHSVRLAAETLVDHVHHESLRAPPPLPPKKRPST
jgi:hypothetical protein